MMGSSVSIVLFNYSVVARKNFRRAAGGRYFNRQYYTVIDYYGHKPPTFSFEVRLLRGAQGLLDSFEGKKDGGFEGVRIEVDPQGLEVKPRSRTWTSNRSNQSKIRDTKKVVTASPIVPWPGPGGKGFLYDQVAMAAPGHGLTALLW